jgi:transposase
MLHPCRSSERAARARPRRHAFSGSRFRSTLPGQEAQVDFGYVGRLYDPTEGQLRKAYVFVMVLGYSRQQFSRICFDKKVETWLLLHVGAFEWFGGVPR